MGSAPPKAFTSALLDAPHSTLHGGPVNVMQVIFSPAFRECSVIITTVLMPLSPLHVC